MVVGERLRAIRETKNMSQGDIERRTGLWRCYVSRVEHGHTIPSIETLEKMARVMEIPLYQVFFGAGDSEPTELRLPKQVSMKLSGRDATIVSKLARLVTQLDDRDKKLLVGMAQKLLGRK